MITSQRDFPTAEEIAVIERRAQAMRTQATAQMIRGIGAWIARRVRGGDATAPRPAKA